MPYNIAGARPAHLALFVNKRVAPLAPTFLNKQVNDMATQTMTLERSVFALISLHTVCLARGVTFDCRATPDEYRIALYTGIDDIADQIKGRLASILELDAEARWAYVHEYILR